LKAAWDTFEAEGDGVRLVQSGAHAGQAFRLTRQVEVRAPAIVPSDHGRFADWVRSVRHRARVALETAAATEE
ncbi:MAG: hypothetical protein KC620_19160, partial [Myxococcales bacterium]|nr:hypothetical protein [Myxococcales bacterium]